MIKALLTTTAMVGFLTGSTFAASAPSAKSPGSTPAQAKSPTLKIDGFTVVNMYSQNQRNRDRGKGGPQPHIAVDASDLYFTIVGNSIGGLEYMYRVNLNAIPNGSPTLQQNYVQFSACWGSIQIGNVRGPENTMIYDASRVIGGTGGFEGGYTSVFNVSALVVNGNDLAGDTRDATKITYYSPEMYGFQIGVGYTPSTAHSGDARLDNWSAKNSDSLPGNKGIYGSSTKAVFGLRNMAAGITWKKEVDVWSVILSAAGLIEQSYTHDARGSGGRTQLRSAKGYQLGFILGYKNFRFGMGFLDNGKSRLPRTNNVMVNGVDSQEVAQGNSGKSFNIGVGYTAGAYQFAASYQGMNRKTDASQSARGHIYSGTVDFTPFQGLKVYGEVDYVKTKTNAAAQAFDQAQIAKSSRPWEVATGNNTAAIAIVGTKISF